MNDLRPYDVWLRGGGSLDGEMTDEEAAEIFTLMKERAPVCHVFQDADGFKVAIVITDIVAFQHGGNETDKTKIGFK